MPSPHLSDDVLELLALDRLSEGAAAPVEEHLLTYAECRERLAGRGVPQFGNSARSERGLSR